ncbi:proline racemase family protein [Nocardioides sp.]|uniref:proline racemase family protein n=1 Tax=Nocardioides sp. TaxID=35761 RepID=UPI002ED41C18
MLPSTITTTDYHTGGEPFRIVADPPVPRLAVLAADGRLPRGTALRHESIVGSTFLGTVLQSVEVDGRAAVIPQVTGNAHRTGEHRFSVDPHDPLVPGFVLR